MHLFVLTYWVLYTLIINVFDMIYPVSFEEELGP